MDLNSLDIDTLFKPQYVKYSDISAVWAELSADVCNNLRLSVLTDIFKTPKCGDDISNPALIVDYIEYFPLSGKSFCELPSTKKLFSKDRLLVSHMLSGLYESFQCMFDKLSSLLLNDIVNALKLGSMSRKNKYEYAISSHNHDRRYSRVLYLSRPYLKSDVENDRISSFGSISISTDTMLSGHTLDDINSNPSLITHSTLFDYFITNKISVPRVPRLMIGTLRFIGVLTMNKLITSNSLIMGSGGYLVNPYDSTNKIRDDFDGWVFPNGREITNVNRLLSAAALIYAGSSSSNFTLPSYLNFFKCNPGVSNSLTSVLNYSVGMRNHSHVISPAKFSGTMELDTDRTCISCTKNTGEGSLVHSNKSSDPSHLVNKAGFEFKLDLALCRFTAMSTTSCAASNGEPKPIHNFIPIMIYIGGETDVFYRNWWLKYNS